jgi:hypothetical protein
MERRSVRPPTGAPPVRAGDGRSRAECPPARGPRRSTLRQRPSRSTGGACCRRWPKDACRTGDALPRRPDAMPTLSSRREREQVGRSQRRRHERGWCAREPRARSTRDGNRPPRTSCARRCAPPRKARRAGFEAGQAFGVPGRRTVHGTAHRTDLHAARCPGSRQGAMCRTCETSEGRPTGRRGGRPCPFIDMSSAGVASWLHFFRASAPATAATRAPPPAARTRGSCARASRSASPRVDSA